MKNEMENENYKVTKLEDKIVIFDKNLQKENILCVDRECDCKCLIDNILTLTSYESYGQDTRYYINVSTFEIIDTVNNFKANYNYKTIEDTRFQSKESNKIYLQGHDRIKILYHSTENDTLHFILADADDNNLYEYIENETQNHSNLSKKDETYFWDWYMMETESMCYPSFIYTK